MSGLPGEKGEGKATSKPLDPAELRRRADELRAVGAFAGLSDDELAWLAERAEFIDFASGEIVTPEGEVAETMMAVLKGELRGRRELRASGAAAADTWAYVWKPGDIAGVLPFTRMRLWPVMGRAQGAVRVASFRGSIFQEMFTRIPVLLERLVHIMVDRARSSARDEEQNQSLLALGRIAAGLAHELNNPTAALQRGARELTERLGQFSSSSIRLAQHEVGDEALAVLAELKQRGSSASGRMLDPISRSERVEELGEWLDDRGVERPWVLAESFLDAGVEVAELERLAAALPLGALVDGLVWLEAMLAADSLARDIDSAAGRVAGLVAAVKSYSYMDRSPERVETDIHLALEDTLKILAHKVQAKGVTVERDYDPALPRVLVHPGEINQVWTNLLDNALDAVEEGGHIGLRTAREPEHVLVEITDDGRGIPAEIQARIWEPFFTTKGVGKGTGLGLDIVQRIVVRRHAGQVAVDSRPGKTRFQVRLPVVALE